MKKLSAIALIFVLMFSTLLGGCSSSSKSSSSGEDTSLDYIMDKGELVVGLDDSFPPMGYRDDNNNIVGFDIDLAKEVCKRMGIKVKFQPVSWESKEQELSSKNIDCIWNGFGITPEREKVLTFTEPYMSNPQIFVVLANSGIKTEADLKGKVVAAQSGSTAYATIEKDTKLKDSFKNFIGVEDNVKALMDLEVGGSDAVAMDTVVARYYMTKEPNKYSIIKDTTILDEEMGVGFRKGDNALCKKVEDTLKEMKKDGTLAKISKEWFGEDLTTIGE
ncbi:MAG: amino acid ABC transporter substrate-binding protein [Intestinibacter bartlettii]|uniref:amino acid ABC transporter substrate-binding protein n=1 Tax=Intestinibacter bartlettii TaxID=261299 RepID=UPI0026EF0007|nr:amino acid ABC transporter substrate-binding protein [Intestinibacter bartlettii]MDO5009768.1 amino acid ABC transporter substrate-binding protein [Intestinibacter bartlettii]